jgi:hypothetical protein
MHFKPSRPTSTITRDCFRTRRNLKLSFRASRNITTSAWCDLGLSLECIDLWHRHDCPRDACIWHPIIYGYRYIFIYSHSHIYSHIYYLYTGSVSSRAQAGSCSASQYRSARTSWQLQAQSECICCAC